MCGICGLAGRDGIGVDPARLRAMNEELRHRGPDDDGELIDGPIGLAMRRLSIIDLDHGAQPISNEDKTIHIVLNGEIYNHEQLRAELRGRGHSFATGSDVEVVIHAYEDEGLECLKRLRGMFALALWDARAERLVLARDAFGIKPLYWSERPEGLAFASELKALMRDPDFPRALDPRALEAYLAFNSIPAPLTIFTAARKLRPGHLLIWEQGRAEIRCWARPRPVPAGHERREPADELAEELRERLRDSVRAHLVSDVPVGVLLSGGVDSSALTALAAEESPERLSTFSIGFEEKSFDELDRARLVARRYGTDHHEEVLRPDAVDLLPRLAHAFDEPMADSSSLATWLVCELASRHVKVVLSGEGADELFGGYFTYVAHRLATVVGRPAALAEPLARRLPSSSKRVSLDYKLKRFTAAAALPPLERHHAFKEIFGADMRHALLDGSHPAGDPVDFLRARHAETAGVEALARLQDVDVGIYLPDDLLVKTDRTSMAHSLEARVPFLDPEVYALAAALPRHLRVRAGAKKRLLRKAIEPLVPRSIVHGPKRGFSIPAAAWLRNELKPMSRDLLAPDVIRRQGIFSPEAVTDVLERHQSGREDLSRQLWGLLTFAVWHEQHLG
ncbi:MAG: Asparagine synthetase [glutamine-hydrolyzing] [uncultured Solirubrobacteraceae bacterium]|uniref:asparagine synthase (glutamine-hydrolyzing) n=1 Tax=uncultured Solirubrobacteraceae bacterium TaxID=1162706 RepID=A0A6J4S8I5_9ACTN|nr:MAG: Asparagine synthetase [glutamine-hydrolyzing] [uncultured Solirubrobacteraceae bacterium]